MWIERRCLLKNLPGGVPAVSLGFEAFRRCFRALSLKQLISSSPLGANLVESCLKGWALGWAAWMEGDIRDAPIPAGRALLAAPELPRLEQEGRGCSHGWICGYLTL